MRERNLALGPVRHACHLCGSCCTGWRVRLADFRERERVVRQAASLGVDEPLVNGALRQVDGRCVFLGEDRRCRIHANFGETEKPLVCQLFPRRALKAEGHVRVGADPGCTSTHLTWKDGPLLSLEMIPNPRDEAFPSDLVPAETGLVQLAGAPGMSVARFMGVLGNIAPGHMPELPREFAYRLLTRLPPIIPHLRDPENGEIIGGHLAPIADFLETLETDRLEVLPPWEGRLDVHSEGFSLELLRRTLFLRIADSTLPPIAQTLVVLGGILACAYADPTPATFGTALSAWSRVSRLDGFWEPMLPDTDMARWVLYG